MGLLSGLMRRATEIAAVEAAKEIRPLLAEDEQVAKAYKFARDMLILTTRRVIFVNRQGLSGSKVEYLSIPYRTVTRFSVESAGNFDLDAELKVWVSGVAEPYQWRFTSDLNIYEMQAVFAAYVLR